MLKKILGIVPKQESDGSYSPSKLALKLGTVDTTDFENISYSKYQGKIEDTHYIHSTKKHENAKW